MLLLVDVFHNGLTDRIDMHCRWALAGGQGRGIEFVGVNWTCPWHATCNMSIFQMPLT